MASKTQEDSRNHPADESTVVELQEDEQIAYEEISVTDTPGFKPMIGIFAYALVSFFLLVVVPLYTESGNSETTLFTYTSVIWIIAPILGGLIYEYWVMKTEGDVW